MIRLFKMSLQYFGSSATKLEEEKKITDEIVNPEGTVVTTPIVPAAAPIAPTREQYGKDVGEMDEAGFYAKYDLDPERDFQNTVNTLNYEYQTSMANYGENAERMYQMGLSNSGVSDIYGANAFSTYLGNMNQAAVDRINAIKKNKASFNEYQTGINKDFATYEQNWKNERTALENSAFATAAQAFNGYNLEEVRKGLIAGNYDQGIIDNVINRLGTLDVGSLKNATSRELAGKILEVIPGFTGSESDIASVNALFGGAVSSEALNAAVNMAKTLYDNSPEAADATVNTWVDTLYVSYTGNEIDFDKWDQDQLADVPEDQRIRIKEAIKQRFDGRVDEIYDAIVSSYTPEQEASMRSYYSQKGYSKSEIDAAISAANDFYNKNPDVKSQHDVWSALDFIGKNIEAWGESTVRDYLKDNGWDEETIDNAFMKFGDSAGGKHYNEMQSQTEDKDYQNAYSTVLGAGLNSKSTSGAIKKILEKSGIEFDDNLIERLRADLADTEEVMKKEVEAQKNAASIIVMDTIDKNLNATMETQGYLSAEDYMKAYADVEAEEAANGVTDATEAKKAEYKNKILTEINGFLKGGDGYDLNNAGGMLVGFLSQDDVDSWDGMSDDERRRAIINAAKTEISKKSGLVNEKELSSMVSSYVTIKVQEIIDTDNSNAKASGLADAGELVNYINSLGLNEQEKKNAMESIRRGMSFRIEGDQINWYDSVSGAEATIYSWQVDKNKVINDYEITEKFQNAYDNQNAPAGIVWYDGKLYGKKGGKWCQIKEQSIKIVGDGHTNSAEQARGIYDLLVYMLDPNVGKLTVSGSSENGGTKGKGTTQGGRAKDFSTENK